MKKLALLVMLLSIVAFATGCPQGPDSPPQVDVPRPEVGPEVPTEDEDAEASEEEMTVPPLPSDEEAAAEEPAAEETKAEEPAAEEAMAEEPAAEEAKAEEPSALPTVDFPTVEPAPAEKPAPAAEEPAPAEEKPAPAEEKPAPAEEKPAPAEEKPAAAEEEAKE